MKTQLKLTEAEQQFIQERTCYDSRGKRHIVYLAKDQGTVNQILAKEPQIKDFLIKYEPNKFY